MTHLRLNSASRIITRYVGSFWDQPYAPGTYHELFEAEEKQLMHDLHDVVRQNLDRKVASLMKRCRFVNAHAHLLHNIWDRMPNRMLKLFGTSTALDGIVDNLDKIYHEVSEKHGIPLPHFPNPDAFARYLQKEDLYSMDCKVRLNELAVLQDAIQSKLPALLQDIRGGATASAPDATY
jgi:hypothetical protein